MDLLVTKLEGAFLEGKARTVGEVGEAVASGQGEQAGDVGASNEEQEEADSVGESANAREAVAVRDSGDPGKTGPITELGVLGELEKLEEIGDDGSVVEADEVMSTSSQPLSSRSTRSCPAPWGPPARSSPLGFGSRMSEDVSRRI